MLEAAVCLPLTVVMLRVFGFARCRAWLPTMVRLRHGRHVDDRLECAQRAARMVQLAARHGLSRATCLPQSLVLWSLLRREGTDSALRVGVRKTPSGLEAHAWVECNGVALNDDADVHTRYSAFDRAIA